ncbi:MAG: site-specific integrase [Muribaculum sp.]|nr:site-specific integrase [Muribaculum sp.]
MIQIKYKIRPFIKANGQVAVRVRWNNNTSEVTFITGMYADRTKWDDDGHRAAKNTTHRFGNREYKSFEINDCIADFREAIEDVLTKYSLKNSIPTTTELKLAVNKSLGRVEEKSIKAKKTVKKTLKQMLDEFLKAGRLEKNWDDDCCEKYVQAYQHITKANPKVTPYNITIETMLNLKTWYIENGYKNRTINKQVAMLKCFLRWISQQAGVSIPDAVLEFNTNLKVMAKTVTFLHFDELMHFAQFRFKNDDPRLSRARDLWCFMAFTSLRYSDLANLKTAHIVDNRIEMMTQKTSDHISVPLTDGALSILKRYKGQETADGHVFDVPTNQKLNDNIKDAAEEAGLDRLIIDTYFVGTKRHETQHKFHEIISCHDARRTFVSCSLAMGIPAQVVMKATGHKGYNTMKPYIDTATETQTIEMEKWNRSRFKSEIILLLDKANEDQMKSTLAHLKSIMA